MITQEQIKKMNKRQLITINKWGDISRLRKSDMIRFLIKKYTIDNRDCKLEYILN